MRTDWNAEPPDAAPAAAEAPLSEGIEGIVKFEGMIGAISYLNKSIECVIMSFTAVIAAMLAW